MSVGKSFKLRVLPVDCAGILRQVISAYREEVSLLGKLFSADGRYLLFNATQDLNPTYSQVEWNYAYTNMGALYMALLSRDGVSPFLPADGETPKAEPAASEPKTAGKDRKTESGKKADKPVVKVDADGLQERIIKIPAGTG